MKVFSVCQNQHDELKRQYYELDEQHQAQGEDHSRLLDEHRDRYNKLQQAKETEISQLKGGDGFMYPWVEIPQSYGFDMKKRSNKSLKYNLIV